MSHDALSTACQASKRTTPSWQALLAPRLAVSKSMAKITGSFRMGGKGRPELGESEAYFSRGQGFEKSAPRLRSVDPDI